MLQGWRDIKVLWYRGFATVDDYGGNQSMYQTLDKRGKTEQEEVLQAVSTALISKILLTLLFK